MQDLITHRNSSRLVRQATVCLVALAFAIGLVRVASSDYDHAMDHSGFKVKNISSPLRQAHETLPWQASAQ